jgi:hypothetical protein
VCCTAKRQRGGRTGRTHNRQRATQGRDTGMVPRVRHVAVQDYCCRQPVRAQRRKKRRPETESERTQANAETERERTQANAETESERTQANAGQRPRHQILPIHKLWFDSICRQPIKGTAGKRQEGDPGDRVPTAGENPSVLWREKNREKILVFLECQQLKKSSCTAAEKTES